jgi:hypothetical protein
MNEQKLHEEGNVVARVKAMPYSQKEEGREVADVLIVEKL